MCIWTASLFVMFCMQLPSRSCVLHTSIMVVTEISVIGQLTRARMGTMYANHSCSIVTSAHLQPNSLKLESRAVQLERPLSGRAPLHTVRLYHVSDVQLRRKLVARTQWPCLHAQLGQGPGLSKMFCWDRCLMPPKRAPKR